ncbi:MAG TPA: VWA domain-containing protein [Solirubrobacteraceae bacterium]|nr:VWA domain-containing protein [Solirubrobacteraceae bacterium]
MAEDVNGSPVPTFAVVDFDVDLPGLASAFSQRLHEAGVPVTPSQTAQYTRALKLTKPVSRRRLYCTTRAIFVTGFQQVAAFDRVFAAVFGGRKRSINPDDYDVQLEDDENQADEVDSETPEDMDEQNIMEREGGQDAMQMNAGDGDSEDDDDTEQEKLVPLQEASEEEALSHKNFQSLNSEELALLYKLMVRLQLATPDRTSRRKKRGRKGEHMDMRRTLRKSLHTGGDPIVLSRKKRRVHPRRLVLLCDISGSMEPYARAYLQFLHAARATGPYAEAFVFATRLTRLTRQLAGRNPQRAIRRATEAAPDWSSGTRIGDALKTFNDRYGRRGMARGSVIVILSDGWERGDPALVTREMQRLARLAYRIVWVNPRVAAQGFSPKAGGLVAALPYCDALVSGHTLKSLEEVADAIAAERDYDPLQASWRIPTLDDEPEEDTWGVAGTTERHVAMPSGYGPYKGNTSPGSNSGI